jgi:hypothetical protein
MADPVYFLPAWLGEIGAIAGLLTLTISTLDRFFAGRLQILIRRYKSPR